MVEADEAHLGLELRTRAIGHEPLHHRDEIDHVFCRSAGFSLDEVGMLVADRCAADAQPLETGVIDKPARAVLRRIAKYRARVGTTGLIRAPPANDLLDP